MKRSRRTGRVLFAASLLVAACLTCRGVEAGQEGRAGEGAGALHKGTPLADALRELEARGLRLVYSSRVVLPEMTVLEELTATGERQILDQLLAQHHLAVEEGPGGSLVVVPGPTRGAPERVAGLDGSSPSRQPFREVRLRQEVVVLPSRISLLSEELEGPLALGRSEILRLPHLGGDVFRALSLLPGIASNEITAQLHVRGGRRDELLVLLDGQELYEAYHLKDFDSALSLVAASTLDRLSLTTGAFPASYGDRMGGVLDLATVTPSPSLRFSLAVSFVTAQLSGSGSFGERGGWLLSARRGLADLAGPLVGTQGPTFWDALGRLDFRPGPSQAIRLNVLVSGDELADTAESDGEIASFDTDYDSAYAWLAHEAIFGDRLFVQTSVSESEVRRGRLATEVEEEKDASVRDGRKLSVLGVQQSWSLQLGEKHSLKAGFEWRRFDSEYDYESDVSFSSPLAALRSWTPGGPFVYRDRLRDDSTGLFLSGRFQPASPVTLEAGARYDRHSVPGEGVLSPRVGVAWG
ncbi:MAG: TonB-dependent receptor, partial [Deltaproteobacteria bacterium]|nr:TonB-dependent receptor [Deltaproteobacteria bacterium]